MVLYVEFGKVYGRYSFFIVYISYDYIYFFFKFNNNIWILIFVFIFNWENNFEKSGKGIFVLYFLNIDN